MSSFYHEFEAAEIHVHYNDGRMVSMFDILCVAVTPYFLFISGDAGTTGIPTAQIQKFNLSN